MKRVKTAIGTMEIDGNGTAVTGVRFCAASGATDAAAKGDAAAAGKPAATDALLERAAAELEAYFAGKLRAFTVPVAFEVGRAGQGGSPSRPTAFRVAVWDAIRSIPFGETRTYGEVARMIGKPLAARAVGQALNRNPIAIIVPCHRVVGGDGSLVGFGGGLDKKEALLVLERAAVGRSAKTPC